MMDLELDTKNAWTIKDKATREAALGAHALGVGDTLSASAHYVEAGRLLENESLAAREASRRNLLRFLAASQYFHGGAYARAQKLARRIEQRFLTEQHRRLLRPFLRDIDERASATYVQTMQAKIRELGASRKFTEALELLKHHPFVLERARLSFARAFICEEQKRYHAAAVFYARAMKFDPDNPEWPHVASALVQWLPAVGRLDEAFEYLQFQLKEIAHPVVKITASVLHYRKAANSEGDDRVAWLKKQIAFFYEAWADFRQLPDGHQTDESLREMMSLCFELAAFAHWKLGENERALQIASEGIAFNQKHAGLWTVRGMVGEMGRERRADFEQAIRLGDTTYIPHYHLAQGELEAEQFESALAHIEEALNRNPQPRARGVLLGRKAICLARQEGTPISAVFELFREAVALAPDVPEVRENFEMFRGFAETEMWQTTMSRHRWHLSPIPDLGFIDINTAINKSVERVWTLAA